MKSIANAQIFAITHSGTFKAHSDWEKQRKTALSSIGQYLLNLNESELNNVYSEWETGIFEDNNTEDIEKSLYSLFLISLLHYYKRLFNQSKKVFDKIFKFLASKNREICKTASRVLYYLGEENPENAQYLRETLEMSKQFLSVSQRNTMSFNAFSIISEVGRFLLRDVFTITMGHQPEIFNASISKDIELGIIASKVMTIHLEALPAHSSETMASSLFLDYTTRILSHTANSTPGMILILSSIYKLYPQAVKIPVLIDRLIAICSVPKSDALIETMDFLIELANQKLFTVAQANQLLLILISQITSGNTDKSIFVRIIAFIQIFPPQNIPGPSILQLVSFLISNESRASLHDKAFKVLCVLLRKVKISVPKSYFTIFSKHSIEALSLSNLPISQFKEELLRQFGLGLNPKTSIQKQKLSLRILSTFRTKLFESMPPLFDALQHNAYSPDEKLRCMMVKILPIFECDGAMDELVRMAAIDTSKRIRLIALKNITDDAVIRNPSLIAQLLADPSFKVRRAAIPIAASVAATCSVLTIPRVLTFTSDLIASWTAYSTPKRSARLCSLLPLIARNFVQFSPPLATTLTYFCVKLLLGEIPPGSTNFDNLNDLVHREIAAPPKPPVDPYSQRVYFIENRHFIEKRDAYLFDTLSELASTLSPYLYQIMPAFVKAFKSPASDMLHLAALNALTSIAIKTKMSLNIPRMFPDVPRQLCNLLNHCSQKVAIAVLKYTGTIGISSSSITQQKASDEVVECNDMRSPRYYTHFVMKALIEMLKEPILPLFTAATTILLNETNDSLIFMKDLMKAYASSLDNDKIRPTLFNYINMITYKCGRNVEPFIDIIEPYLITYIKELECIQLCARLSLSLVSEFIPTAAKIFPLVLEHARSTSDNRLFKDTLRLLNFCIIFQRQNPEEYLEFAENVAKKGDDIRIAFIFKSLSLLVQNSMMNLYSSRLARLSFSTIQRRNLREVQQLLINLVASGDLSTRSISVAINVKNLKFPIQEIENDVNKMVNNQIPSIDAPRMELPPEKQQNSIFQDLTKPTFFNATLWLDDICKKAVASSPSIAVRCCLPLITHSQTFASELFIAAFISCWKEATEQEKLNFSLSLKMIIENASPLEQRIIDFAQAVDRAGFPLQIPDDVIARGCDNTAYRLYFLQRQYMKEHKPEVAAQLLKLNTKMGRMESARGLLRAVSSEMDFSLTGKWLMQLNEWESALEFFTCSNNLAGLIPCYGHLEMWNRITMLEKDFNKMDEESQSREALWFAWAFYHSKDKEKVNYYLSKFNMKTLNQITFAAIYYTSSHQYDKAETIIEKGFQMIADERKVFSGGDGRRASANLACAQHLVELSEVLQVKRGQMTDITEIWKNRLENFSHESDSWMLTSEIRSLILSPNDHLDSYLKMLRVLRQERQWRLADSHCERFFNEKMPPRVLVEQLKIIWDRGNRKKAVSIASLINDKIAGIKNSQDETEENLQFLSNLSVPVESFNKETQSRLLRLQATWQYRLYTSKTSGADSLKQICNLFKRANDLRPNDPKIWSGWAYTSSRALSHFPEQRAKFAEMAMTGFLKAAKLSPSESFEYMCQTFSIFFRFGAETGISDSLRNEFETLPSSTVNMIVPQIAVHIADVDETIRAVVQKIMIRFGDQHFQAVVYPLNVLSLIQDKDKAAIARDVLENLGMKQSHMYNEIKLFIDGMHRAAVSWNELWLTGLDNASRANGIGDIEQSYQVIQGLFDMLEKPQCQMDHQFIKTMGPQISRAKTMFERAKTNDENSIKMMWAGFKEIYQSLNDKMKHTEQIDLNNVCEELANKNDFEIAVPGLYSVEGQSQTLRQIDNILGVMSTQQHPRTAWMSDAQGNRWKFLLKGNEDLRLDQRIIQFFMLINSMLRSSRATSDLGVSIVEYSIVPFAPNAGFISWVTGADTFQQLVSEYRQNRGSGRNAENEVTNTLVGPLFNSLNALQRYEIFNHVAEATNANEIREMLWLRSPGASSWIQRSNCFTVSTALMSMAGYVIGLGDRHPSNIMVQRHTGRVIHIDFGFSFEDAMNRTLFPERVQFRLTRMIVNALDGGSVSGLFRKTCEDVMWVLKNGMSSVMSQLEVFVHEPIFYGKEAKPSDAKLRGILERVASKLSGIDQDGEEKDVKAQVDSLIKVAADPKEYCRHYIGWCPFW
ncbi:PIKK family atypical protein kinase [Trichomonas vaginalis G3]|uniref:non-specific serine/threonine protein kinase n=1 Tax=Trichomonas vaginalis (strain ATCC PRA-98 / G3) TaxID=412133 RepID=A2ELE0_TRIV3|nr:ataxia telangiectasia mutated (ATM) -related family [Trichomonas vaginalis G3]EAY06542.1 PIKK family atypical protein kinase [Trichomonas vaginalis G3]KAI5526111.1 ataxia telangiectasia mutated (ATM) -related family [Trichomonas vaginalis G3]|eukprot:XP_001318765.1 PIKK family atypical protein kinase [Trichomonas vaginalis G3]